MFGALTSEQQTRTSELTNSVLKVGRMARYPLSRRFTLAMALLLPFCAKAAPAAEPMDDIVSQLIARAERQAQLFNAGRMLEWNALVGIGEGFTLMEPFGGPASHGFNATEERLAALARNFRNGTARLEVDQTYASDDLVVLVYVERNDGEVHGLPNQDWSLRVTQVFQRQGDDWKLVHRHADPLVHSITLADLSSLAAGRGLPEVE
ncbi:MAG TPA: nuclear transport factor 2 family protein [Rhodocyclaceae bacterium]